MRKIDLVGMRFGLLTVVECVGSRKEYGVQRIFWKCRV